MDRWIDLSVVKKNCSSTGRPSIAGPTFLGVRRAWGMNRGRLYVLFVYREVCQSSTGFPPFKLLYGRAPRGPLRETWEGTGKLEFGECCITHPDDARDRMNAMKELVTENLEKAQHVQKK